MMIAFFLLGAIVGSTLGSDAMPEWLVSLADAFATLAATFIGAWLAFRFESRREDLQKRERNIDALNQTLFELVSLYNKFLSIKRQFIEPHKNSRFEHLVIPPMAGIIPPASFDYRGINFVLHSANPNILGTLSRVELEASTTLDVVRQRTDLHYSKAQSAAERALQRRGANFTELDVESELGPRDLMALVSLTKAMVKGVDDVLESTYKHIEALHDIGREMFPGARIIKMDLPPASTAQ